MKIAANIVGGFLGFVFAALSTMFLLGMFGEMPSPPADTPAFYFDKAFGPTGYMKFVKVMEVLGGILVAIPLTRNLGLLILGPILINVIAYHAFVLNGVGLFNPMIIVLGLMMLFLLWVERAAFLSLIHRPAAST